MIVTVDTSNESLGLRNADTFTAFHVAAPVDATYTEVAAVLGTDLPDQDDHVWVPVELIRELAGNADPSWERGFATMLKFAATRDWLTADGSRILAHVERE